MALATIYNKNYASPAQITDELYSNVGSSAFQLGTAARAFKGSTDFIIRTASGGGGTLLTEGVDYTLSTQDSQLTVEAGYAVYSRVTVTNATYQTGDLYFTYKVVMSYTDASFFNDMRTDVDTAIAGSVVLRGFVGGLEISNSPDEPNTTILVQPGQATTDDNSKYLTLTSIFYCNLSGTFTKGAGASGVGNSVSKLDTGSVVNNTFYYFWVIEQDSTGDIDILISASQTSPTMPSGWTAKRRIRGAVLTDGSANILKFRQKDNEFKYDVLIEDFSEAISATTRQTKTLSVPPNFFAIVDIFLFYNGGQYVLITEIDETDTAATTTYYNIATATNGAANGIEFKRKVNSSSQIGYRANSANGSIACKTIAFIDRG